MSFDYTLNEKKSWPPQVRPTPPFGLTSIEVMRSCNLRVCFEASPNYERRLGSAARIGTVLHRTLQSFNQHPISAETTEALAAETHRRFQKELREQQEESASRPREQSLVWDIERANHALEASISEAIRTQNLSAVPKSSQSNKNKHLNDISGSINKHPSPALPEIEVEVEVFSKDRIIRGRIDRVERKDNAVRLIDYKSAFRDDLPERYARQLQLYAYLWHETRGIWPNEALVFYPMLGSFHKVPVDESTCKRVADESFAFIDGIQNQSKPFEKASPGEVCQVCEFRPWCRPFWTWQNGEKNQMHAVDRAKFGFEGSIKSIKLGNCYWHLLIDWHNAQVKINSPQERFPQLQKASTGQIIRVLDTPLRGQLYQPMANITNQSEIFLLVS